MVRVSERLRRRKCNCEAFACYAGCRTSGNRLGVAPRRSAPRRHRLARPYLRAIRPGGSGNAHAIGPFVNVYNEGTAGWLAARGAVRICLPPELPAASIATIARAVAAATAIEVFAFGRIPLAISARCYHARAHGLHKDNCRFVCGEDPDGMPVETLDAEPFLAVNGLQTLSHAAMNLSEDVVVLAQAGVSALRLSPQRCDMAAVARTFRDVLDGRSEPARMRAALAALLPGIPFANGFLHGRPGADCRPSGAA